MAAESGRRGHRGSRSAKSGPKPPMAEGDGPKLRYDEDSMLGKGSFGVVFVATLVETGERVAVKKVLQDKRFKNRELSIMRTLDHPNVVALRHHFYVKGEGAQADNVYLNLVLEFVPQTIYRVVRMYHREKQLPPLLLVKLFTYQMLRSLAYVHALGICHRDIKPQNLLVDPDSGVLKLCDFGSAKKLTGDANVSYICSRYYRSPELIFGSTSYTTQIDVWSAGCVFGELLCGRPLFAGESGVDQLVEIVRVLGTPSAATIAELNPSFGTFRFPEVEKKDWNTVIPSTPPDAIDLLSKLLVYVPNDRLTAIEALAHPFFDELRRKDTTLASGKPLPPLFNFTEEELRAADPALHAKLIPEWYSAEPPEPAASAAAAAGGGGRGRGE